VNFSDLQGIRLTLGVCSNPSLHNFWDWWWWSRRARSSLQLSKITVPKLQLTRKKVSQCPLLCGHPEQEFIAMWCQGGLYIGS